MKTVGVVLVWVMTAVLMIAVCITAVSDRLALQPLTVEAIQTTAAETSVVNLNTATKEELCKLPGLGETLAERVLAYRTQYGSFRRVEDLLDIDGIGEKRLEQWRAYITV